MERETKKGLDAANLGQRDSVLKMLLLKKIDEDL
jgi:hypothetical protein